MNAISALSTAELAQRCTVEIRQASTLVATAFVDDIGGFDCGPIAAGPTEVRVTAADGMSIVVADLVL